MSNKNNFIPTIDIMDHIVRNLRVIDIDLLIDQEGVEAEKRLRNRTDFALPTENEIIEVAKLFDFDFFLAYEELLDEQLNLIFEHNFKFISDQEFQDKIKETIFSIQTLFDHYHSELNEPTGDFELDSTN